MANNYDLRILYTDRARLDKAMASLKGILAGVLADGVVRGEEIDALQDWLAQHHDYRMRHPFTEIHPRLTQALADRRFDPEEIADVQWLCSRYENGTGYCDRITADMQELQGIMGGIAFDGVVNADEMHALQGWMGEHEHLKGCWPYDEVESLITKVLADGVIDRREQDMLVQFLSEFVNVGDHRALGVPFNELDKPIMTFCAVAPTIEIPGRLFCFTGESSKCSRDDLCALVTKAGGRAHPNVVKNLDYLVVCAEGDPCWAYSCYGRKVEKALDYRKRGCKLLIVHEVDFWDAAQAVQ